MYFVALPVIVHTVLEKSKIVKSSEEVLHKAEVKCLCKIESNATIHLGLTVLKNDQKYTFL